jgi:catechol 2,3-dioxygenase-like lactoylglutathione lyase family enzyme
MKKFRPGFAIVVATMTACAHGDRRPHDFDARKFGMKLEMRVARPTDNLSAIATMYQKGLGFEILASFTDHEGFDGVILGHQGWGYHLEFTHHRGERAGSAPTEDHLLVFYVPNQEDWKARCEQMRKAGFVEVKSYNPYWDRQGKTFADPDGYRVVLQNSSWEP